MAMAIVVDKWRWGVFSGEIAADRYNDRWWRLSEQYQGIAPPIARDEQDFDAGMFYHISNNVPYDRYFIASILQFDFFKGLCATAGHRGPLHTCSIYGIEAAGKRLRSALQLGASRPWPDALNQITGHRQLDASALLDYFAPLMAWLERENAGRQCAR